MQKPCEGNWSAAKRVLRYLKGTQDFGIKYTRVDDFSLIGYFDSDFDGDKETGVSTSGYVIVLDQELSLGDHANNQFQQIPQQKQNTWQRLRQQKKLCGSGKFLKICR